MIFFFCGPAERVVVVPDHLDREIVGLRARRGEMRLGILPGAIRTSRSASAIADGCDLCENEW
jgi:hypothetical protein